MKASLSGLQWMAFMIAGTIVAPIAIADLFGLSTLETSEFIQRTMFVLGVSSLLQGLFGHRLPINEGPAGLWWGVFAIYAGLSATLFSSNLETLQALQGAMMVSGIVFILLSVFRLVNKLVNLFTPVVSGVYLILLVLQLSGSFINGILGVGYRKGTVDLPIAFFCLLLIIFTYYLSKHRIKVISQYSILISLSIGWAVFTLLKLGKTISIETSRVVDMPKFFAFGGPTFDSGMIFTAFFVTLLLLTNMIASIRVVNGVLESKDPAAGKNRFKQAGFIGGVNQILGGIFSAVGSVPISGAAGFIATTNISKIIPFLMGASFVTLSSLFPPLMSFFAHLPTPIGYSVMFVVFANMISVSFAQIDREKEVERVRLVIGISLLAGVGAMFVPGSAFQEAPPIVTSILNNGLILGSVVAILTDQLTKRMKR
ncbi:purine/pyrimidine permease [Bacillus sp. 31A1R]|uniref:Purine/pyrimidine permease n=1 Tax=Robertmurraya mangrovi TaxID=3098077 RepID=A0ABU5J055_9BACI|nr:purine/pyrimidine permease [Bacillus sp. 31A1R]MDZ5472732.1 purine/pyrimidine permease [Bacillus sp. 31A1R]